MEQEFPPVVPRQPVITSQQDVVDALVAAIVDGDAATSQHIVDTLGAHARPSGCSTEGLDWSCSPRKS